MPILVFIFELLLFAIGTYIYLFSRGIIKSSNPETRERMEAFRKSNGLWMRIAGLALMAINGANIVIQIGEWLR
jgi:hypothetical protein